MREHIAGLDGLRAIACLAIFGVHFQQLTGFDAQVGPVDLKRLLENGNTGVALFFVLSGFLLSLPYWSGHLSVKGQPWIVRYAMRRIVRIVPVYYLCLTALVMHEQRWATPADRVDLLLHYLFLHN